MEALKACHQEQIEEAIKISTSGRNIPQSISRLSAYIHNYPRSLCNYPRLSTAIWRAQR
jgi:hypothetical protein